MIKSPVWVRCLNCGNEWYLEEYGSKYKCCCPVCSSGEYEKDYGYFKRISNNLQGEYREEQA
jgi:Zn finger protein HypA/HybF involved in hydrogenase expression